MTYKDVIENMLESNSELDDEIEFKIMDYEGETTYEVDNVEIQYDRTTKRQQIKVFLVEQEETKSEPEQVDP